MTFGLIAGYTELQFRVLLCDVREPCALVFLFLRRPAEIDELPAFFNPVTYDQFFGTVGFAETARADYEHPRRVIG